MLVFAKNEAWQWHVQIFFYGICFSFISWWGRYVIICNGDNWHLKENCNHDDNEHENSIRQVVANFCIFFIADACKNAFSWNYWYKKVVLTLYSFFISLYEKSLNCIVDLFLQIELKINDTQYAYFDQFWKKDLIVET